MFRAGTIGAVAVLLIAASPIPNSDHTPAQQQTSNAADHHQGAQAKQDARAPSVQPIPVAVTGTLHITADDKTQRRDAAQQRAEKSFWDFSLTDLLLAIFTAALVGVGIFQWCAMMRQEGQLRRSVIEMRKAANKQARDTGSALAISKQAANAATAGQRAWIGIEAEIDGPFEWDADGQWGSIRIKAKIKNHGNSPATRVGHFSRVTAAYYVTEDISATIQQSRDHYQLALKRRSGFGYSVLPGEVIADDLHSSIKLADFRVHATPGEGSPPGLVICVGYKFAGGEGFSAASYALLRSDSPAGDLRYVVEGEAIAASELRLERLGEFVIAE